MPGGRNVTCTSPTALDGLAAVPAQPDDRVFGILDYSRADVRHRFRRVGRDLPNAPVLESNRQAEIARHLIQVDCACTFRPILSTRGELSGKGVDMHLISVNVHGGEIQRKARSAAYLQIVVRARTARERLVEAHHAHASWGRQHRAQTEGRPCGRPFDSELICLNATGTILSVSRKRAHVQARGRCICDHSCTSSIGELSRRGSGLGGSVDLIDREPRDCHGDHDGSRRT